MYSILTCQLVISCMNTRCNLIPILTSIFISIFLFIRYYYPVNNLMWTFQFIFIIKCTLSLLQIMNPTTHFFWICSKWVIKICWANFTPLQFRHIAYYISKSSLFYICWIQLNRCNIFCYILTYTDNNSSRSWWIWTIVFKIKNSTDNNIFITQFLINHITYRFNCSIRRCTTCFHKCSYVFKDKKSRRYFLY